MQLLHHALISRSDLYQSAKAQSDPNSEATNIINRLVGLVLTKRLPLFNPSALLNIPLNDLDLRYPCDERSMLARTSPKPQCLANDHEEQCQKHTFPDILQNLRPDPTKRQSSMETPSGIEYRRHRRSNSSESTAGSRRCPDPREAPTAA